MIHHPMRIRLPLIASVAPLAMLAACASTTVEFAGSAPTAQLCQRQAETGTVLVVWGTQWRPDQKDVPLREAAAEQGLKDYLAQSRCFPRAQVRRTMAGEPLTAEHAKQLATADNSGVVRVVVITVRELGPIVKLLSSAALVEGGTEVVLKISSYDVNSFVAENNFTIHWKNGGPGVVKGVDTLPQDMRAALAVAFEQGVSPK